MKQQTEGFEPSPPVSSNYYHMQIIDSTTFIYRVEGAIEFGLDSPVEESDEENETAPYHLRQLYELILDRQMPNSLNCFHSP